MRLNASHLFYAMVALISVFLMVAVTQPSDAAIGYAPMATTITNCDPNRLERPCAASGGDVLLGGEVRVS